MLSELVSKSIDDRAGRRVAGQAGCRATAWAIGSTAAADGVALAAAYRYADSGETPPIDVHAAAVRPSDVPISFAFGDLSGVPIEEREASFRRHERRFVPTPVIAERVLLGEPTQLVDLVTYRAGEDEDRAEAERSATEAVRTLRPGGLLLVVNGSSADGLPASQLQLLDAKARIYRKRDGSTLPVARFVPSSGAAEPPVTLAEVQLHQQLVEEHLRLAWALARRFSHRGEAPDDLDQVALLALVKAARRYDPSREVAFSTFATASILGELKRHFRDKTWMLRVPRSLQELFLSVKIAREELTQELGTSPTTRQIAERLEVSEDAVREALDAADSYSPASLDTSPGEDGAPTELAVIEPAFDRALDRHRLAEVLPRLDDVERLIIKRLYFDQWTQRQVADEIGVSQMQVSRLASRIVTKLRGWLADPAA